MIHTRITVAMAFHKKGRINYVAVAGKQKSLIIKYYDFLSCVQKGGVLYCYGEYQPCQLSDTYKFRIMYKPPESPKVKVLRPAVKYNDDLHMYANDNSLCLYHKSDLVWDITKNLHDTIVPWTLEWFVFYELYLITGKWEHPFVPHGKIEKEEY